MLETAFDTVCQQTSEPGRLILNQSQSQNAKRPRSQSGSANNVSLRSPRVDIQARTIDEKKGDLEEIANLEQREKKREQAGAKTLDQLINLAIARRYKNPRAWAYHVHSARSRKFG